MLNKAAIFLPIFAACVFGGKGFVLEYKNGETETLRRPSFKQEPIFRSQGRQIRINPKTVERMEIFSDTLEIHFGETWMRVNVSAATKDTVPLPPVAGWMRINAALKGITDFGNTEVPVFELKSVTFRIPEATPAPAETAAENEAENAPQDLDDASLDVSDDRDVQDGQNGQNGET